MQDCLLVASTTVDAAVGLCARSAARKLWRCAHGSNLPLIKGRPATGVSRSRLCATNVQSPSSIMSRAGQRQNSKHQVLQNPFRFTPAAPRSFALTWHGHTMILMPLLAPTAPAKMQHSRSGICGARFLTRLAAGREYPRTPRCELWGCTRHCQGC